MKIKNENFTLDQVERLIKNAYEVGFCDGEEPANMRMYRNSNDFWDSNKKLWINSEINYVK